MRVAGFPQFVQYFVAETISHRLVCVDLSGIIRYLVSGGTGPSIFSCRTMTIFNGGYRS